MDMQSTSITNIGEVYTNTLNTTDSYTLGTSINQNIEINGTLTFGPSSMILVNGNIVNPSDLQNASFVSPILDSGYEERITKLEAKNKELKDTLFALTSKLDYLEKYVQL